MESTMTHTGDDYEARARAARHQEAQPAEHQPDPAEGALHPATATR